MVMNVNRVGPSGQDPIKKKQALDPKDFEEHRKIEKVRDVDPEEQKKSKRYQKEEEEEEPQKKEPTVKVCSPFDVYPTSESQKNTHEGKKPSKTPVSSSDSLPKPPDDSLPKPLDDSLPKSLDDSLPKSPEFWEENHIQDSEKKPPGHDDHIQFTEFHSTKDKAHGQFRPPNEERVSNFQPEHPSLPTKKKKTVSLPIDKPLPREIYQPNLVIPPDIMVQANQSIGSNVSFQHSDIQRLFSNIVGTVMVMMRDGITRTEVHLNRPEFENSILFGTVISVEHYKTAPDSFNVRLMGTPQAVNVYNDNLGQLMAAFQKPELKFQISRIDVEIDTSSHSGTFKRKSKKGKKDTETGL